MPREHRPDPAARRRLDRFDEALRRWAQRPAPPTPPWPPNALLRAGRRHAAPRWRLAVASLALVAAVAAGLLMRTRWAPPGAAPAAAPAGAAVAALASPDEVLILWLDADTPLYLTLPSAAETADFERSTR